MKKMFWIGPAILLLLVIGLLPNILSSSFGTKILEWYLSDSKTTVLLSNPSFHWGANQSIEHITFTSQRSKTEFNRLTSSASFFQFLSGKMGETSLEKVMMTLDGLPEVNEASSRPVHGNFTIHSLQIAEKTTGLRFVAKEVAVVNTPERTSLFLNGESTSPSGKGSLGLVLDCTYPIFSPTTQFTLQCSINRVPTEVFSALASISTPQYAPLIPEIFGPNITLEIRGDKHNDELHLSFKPFTNNLSGEANLRLSKGLMTLSRSSTLAGIITPSLFNQIFHKRSVTLDAPSHFVCKLDKLAIPLTDSSFEWEKAALSGSFEANGGRVTYSKNPIPFYLQDMNLSFKSDSLANAVSLSGKIEADYGQKVLSILTGSISLDQPLSAKRITGMNLQAQQLPLLPIELATKQPIATYLGDYGSGSLFYNGKELTGEIATTLLQTTPFSFTAKGMFRLQSPVKLSYLPSETLVGNFFNQAEISGVISSLQFNPNNIKEISGSGTFSSAPLQGSILGHSFKVPDIQLTVDAESFSSISLSGSTLLRYSTVGFLQALIPATMPISFSGVLNGNTGAISNIVLSVDTNTFTASVRGLYSDKQFRFTDQATFIIQPAIQLINGNITRLSKEAPIIRSTSAWKIAIASLKIANSIVESQGMLQTESITFETQNLLFPTTIQGLRSTFILGKNNEYTFSGTTGNGQIECKLETGETTSVSLSGKSIPTAVIDTLLGVDESYTPLLGEIATLTASMKGTKICDEAQVSLNAPLLSGSFTLNRSGDIYELKGGSSIQWTMTPSAYENIADPTTRMKLTLPAEISLTFNSYTFPVSFAHFFPTKKEYLSPGAMSGALTIPSMYFLDTKSNEKVSLSKLSSSLHRKSQTAPLSFSLRSDVRGSGKETKPGVVSFSGNIDHYTLPDGKLSLEKAELSAKGEISTMPSSLVDALLAASGSAKLPPSALFGPTISLSFASELNQGRGPLTMDLHSPYFRADIDGFVEKGTAYLQKPMTATIVMTPALSHALLGSVSVDALSIEKPITLIISPKGFSIPLLPFSIAKSRVGYGRLDLGQIIVRDTGTPTTIGDIFEVKKRANTVHLWFAPLDFAINDGYMLIDRTEILYDKTFDIAIWGNVDLIKEYANMTLGLTAQSLHAALGLQLPPNYVMQVPFKGPLNNVKIDKGAALAKIAFIVAREQGKQSNNVYGNLFGILGDLADDQSTVPPAKHPFPWEK